MFFCFIIRLFPSFFLLTFFSLSIVFCISRLLLVLLVVLVAVSASLGIPVTVSQLELVADLWDHLAIPADFWRKHVLRQKNCPIASLGFIPQLLEEIHCDSGPGIDLTSGGAAEPQDEVKVVIHSHVNVITRVARHTTSHGFIELFSTAIEDWYDICTSFCAEGS